MEKSPEAFRTISEVADFLETPAHVLRFWESRFPQIRPVKRAGGRRYYRPSDVALLAGIKRLLHDDGMTIRGVQKILREHGIRYVAALGDGADPALLSDMVPDAPLPPDFTILERFDNPAQTVATHTAQIIPLDAAMGRGETSRDAEPTPLWPAAEEVTATESGTEEMWPTDPGNPGETVGGVVAEPDLFTTKPLSPPAPDDVAAEVTEEADAAPPSFAGTVGEPVQNGIEAFPSMPIEGHSTGAEAEDTPRATATTPDPPAESEQSGSAAASAKVGSASEAETQAETHAGTTVAALLRRAQRARLAGAQAELRDIRDRLILLRGRVADAARRRVK